MVFQPENVICYRGSIIDIKTENLSIHFGSFLTNLTIFLFQEKLEQSILFFSGFNIEQFLVFMEIYATFKKIQLSGQKTKNFLEFYVGGIGPWKTF